MPHYELGPFRSGNYLVGNRDRNRPFPQNQVAIIYAEDKTNADRLARATIGDHVAVGYFDRNSDFVGDWIQEFQNHPEHQAYAFSQVIEDTIELLGSITVESYSFYIEDEKNIIRFHIQTSEGEKRRVLASEVNDNGLFVALPAEFTFTPYWLAKLITDQY